MHLDLYSTLMSASLWDSSQTLGSPEDLHSWTSTVQIGHKKNLLVTEWTTPWSLDNEACLVVFAIWVFVCFTRFAFVPAHLLSSWVYSIQANALSLWLMSVLLNLKQCKLILLHACVSVFVFELPLPCRVGLAQNWKENFWVKGFVGNGYLGKNKVEPNQSRVIRVPSTATNFGAPSGQGSRETPQVQVRGK